MPDHGHRPVTIDVEVIVGDVPESDSGLFPWSDPEIHPQGDLLLHVDSRVLRKNVSRPVDEVREREHLFVFAEEPFIRVGESLFHHGIVHKKSC